MKKILVTRRLLRSCEDKAKEIFDVNFNLNDVMNGKKVMNGGHEYTFNHKNYNKDQKCLFVLCNEGK